MTLVWTIQTRGDPAASLQKILHTIWEESGLDGIITPLCEDLPDRYESRLVSDLEKVGQINPFSPLMLSNSARRLPALLKEHPGKYLGVIFRPCEMRAWAEISPRFSFPAAGLLTICVDCLGTYPKEDYRWRMARLSPDEGSTEEKLQFARQGGISAYRFRQACQSCRYPYSASAGFTSGADINIGVIGLPVRKYLLFMIKDEATAQRLHLDELPFFEADSSLLLQREIALSKLGDRNRRVYTRRVALSGEKYPNNIASLLSEIERCRHCRACMDACPVYRYGLGEKSGLTEYNLENFIEWVRSCVGCGMCEEACPEHRPLSTVFRSLLPTLPAAA